MNDNFDILIKRLNAFRKKYYFFKFLRGLFFSLILGILFYTIISIIEYFAFFPPFVRTFIFYSFILFIFYVFVIYILIPFFLLVNVFKQINHQKLSKIIVKHFPDIKDRLLNIIELSKLDESIYSNEIVWASIDQKINEIKLFKFEEAINIKQLKFVFIYFFMSVVVVFGILIFDKPILAESNYRIINYSSSFSKPAPYKYVILSKKLNVKKGDEFVIEVKCEGENLPQVVYINIEGNNYLMKKDENNIFNYRIESVINSFGFYFTDLKYSSENYILTTIPKPNISDFEVKVIPPEYTRAESQSYNNIGDLKIPEGTDVKWIFKCFDTDSLFLLLNNTEKLFGIKAGNTFTVESKVFNNCNYSIFIKNKNVEFNEALSYTLSVVPDLFPEIKVIQTRDSTVYSRFYFKGQIADDYGFSCLNFHLNINEHDSIFQLEVIHNLVNQDFYYMIDFTTFNIGSNEAVYYFSVSDNDKIKGPKTTTSNSFVYKAPTFQEISQYDKEQFDHIQNMVNKSKQLSNEIKEDLKELQYKSLDPKITNWEKSQLANEIVNKQNKLEQLIDEVKEQNRDLNNLVNSFSKQDKEIIDKQSMVEDLLDQVFSDELKKLMDEFRELAKEFNSEKFDKSSQKMNMSYDDLSKQLDRNLEMLKKMKVEQKIDEIINKISQLADNESILSSEINEKRNFEDVLKRDLKNKEDLNVLKEDLNNALKLNDELKKPTNFDNFDIEFKGINDDFKINEQNLNNRNKNKSAQSLKSTSGHLNDLAFNMRQLLKSNTKEENMENIENLKQILSNLMRFSFSQEEIMTKLSNSDLNDPLLSNLKREEKNLKDQSGIIKDSLYALANRTPQINSLVNSELLSMEINLNKAISNMDNGIIAESRANQQFVMTSANNLALLLNEALVNLEKQMASNKEGNQQCENPGQKPGGKNLDLLKQSSEQMKQQLQKMINEMKKGNNKEVSKMLGESLMQHEMMQQMLRELMNNGSVGSEARNQLQDIDKLLEENRKELINRSVSDRTLIRQNQIQTRLLEAEKSEIERDLDDKRESKTATETFYSNPVKYFDYKKQTNLGKENLNQGIFKLNDYYNKKYKQYLNFLNSTSVNNSSKGAGILLKE
jgi:hypothetical protein